MYVDIYVCSIRMLCRDWMSISMYISLFLYGCIQYMYSVSALSMQEAGVQRHYIDYQGESFIILIIMMIIIIIAIYSLW